MNIKNIMPVTLIVIGSFLEVFYSVARYTQDGLTTWLSIIIGIGLNVFLIMTVYQKKNVLAVSLMVFSIISTSAGQTFSLIQKQQSEYTAKVNPEISELQKQNGKLQLDIDTVTKQKAGTIETLEDRYTWKKTLSLAEKEIEQKTKLIEQNRNRIDSLQDGQGSKENQNIYTFYSGLTGNRLKADWLKFILHTVLSFFISIMSPFGVRMIDYKVTVPIPETKQEVKPEPKTEVIPEVKPEAKKSLSLDDWISLMWSGEKKGNPRTPSETLISGYCQSKDIQFNLTDHINRLLESKHKGLINDNGLTLKSEKEAREILKTA